MSYQPFDVVIVPFPYSDRLAEKRRPALVVSDPAVEKDHGRLWVAMITSVPSKALGDCQVTDLAAAGLPVISQVRASKLATLDVDRILRRSGRLSAKDQKAAEAALKSCAAF